MCVWVEVEGEICETQLDLMGALGTADLVPDRACGYDDTDIRWSLCLCPVDIEATARKYGYRVERLVSLQRGCAWRLSQEKSERERDA